MFMYKHIIKKVLTHMKVKSESILNIFEQVTELAQNHNFVVSDLSLLQIKYNISN